MDLKNILYLCLRWQLVLEFSGGVWIKQMIRGLIYKGKRMKVLSLRFFSLIAFRRSQATNMILAQWSFIQHNRFNSTHFFATCTVLASPAQHTGSYSSVSAGWLCSKPACPLCLTLQAQILLRAPPLTLWWQMLMLPLAKGWQTYRHFFSWFHKWNELDVVHEASPHVTAFTLFITAQGEKEHSLHYHRNLFSKPVKATDIIDFLRFRSVLDVHCH